MTTVLFYILAVIAMVVLIIISVLGAVWLKGKLDELEADVDDMKAKPGQYHPVEDISSMHPSSVIQTTPFGYSYSGKFNDLYHDRIDYKKRLNRLELEVLDDSELSLVERVKKLEDDVRELNQFYYIPSDSDDKSLVDMYKDLEERCNKLFQMMSDRITDIHDLRFKYEVLKSAYPKQTEYKITVGDDPNWMQNGTTVSTAETIPHFTQYKRTIPYVKAPYEFCKIKFKTMEDAKAVAKAMRTAIEQNGYCSVGRYLELSGGKTIPEDFNHGWTDLNGVYVKSGDDDVYPYSLVLPGPEELDEEENEQTDD